MTDRIEKLEGYTLARDWMSLISTDFVLLTEVHLPMDTQEGHIFRLDCILHRLVTVRIVIQNYESYSNY